MKEEKERKKERICLLVNEYCIKVLDVKVLVVYCG